MPNKLICCLVVWSQDISDSCETGDNNHHHHPPTTQHNQHNNKTKIRYDKADFGVITPQTATPGTVGRGQKVNSGGTIFRVA
ncbi:hypothetical protein C0Q70_15593 [Pomacea canaliculata]|uniref:Uncharacterized protein n=1 Tax=Pomacea canaliculata TaxID=400727 RepID=A0A2T7NVA7_POMCA|nr:hypothetical protein C0Q70_15593 [Pomacea canaliculata]